MVITGRWAYNLGTEVLTVWFLPEKKQRSRSEGYLEVYESSESELDTVIGNDVKIGTFYLSVEN